MLLLADTFKGPMSKAGSLMSEAAAFPCVEAARDSGPQGFVKPFTFINDPCAWSADVWQNNQAGFTHTLNPQDLQEIHTAVRTFITAATTPDPTAATTTTCSSNSSRLSHALVCMDKTAFPLPHLGPKLRTLADQQLRPGNGGRGFQLLRGLPMVQQHTETSQGKDLPAQQFGSPVTAFSKEEALVAYMGIAAHMGYNFSPQRKDGKMVHHIKDTSAGTTKGKGVGAADSAAGSSSSSSSSRSASAKYAESTMAAAMGFHTDAQGDALGLLCLQQAPEGGESSLVSAAAVHNEMLRLGRQDLVQLMAAPGIWCRNKDRYQHIRTGEEPWWDMPVFDYTAGTFRCHYAPTNHYTEAFDMYGPMGLGSMSPQQAAAIQLFESIASSSKFTLKFTMQTGDMLFLDNTAVLHARSSFVDGELPHQKRHLVRLWLLDQELITASAAAALNDSTVPPSCGKLLPRHLLYPRDYSPGSGYSYEACAAGLMRPDPDTFSVPLDAEE